MIGEERALFCHGGQDWVYEHLDLGVQRNTKREESPQDAHLGRREPSAFCLMQPTCQSVGLCSQQIVKASNRRGWRAQRRIAPLPNPVIRHALIVVSAPTGAMVCAP